MNDTMGKSIEYTFASNTSGSFYVTTSFDKDFVVDLFQIQLEDVVQLKNAMTRSWKPDGSTTTFNVAKLLGILPVPDNAAIATFIPTVLKDTI